MILLPAIDLYEQKAVRLYKGNYAEMTVYNDNPVAQAKQFASDGATWMHVVDLEGAKVGEPRHLSLIAKIVQETGLNVEVGGGIRDLSTIDAYLSAGVKRVIIGSKALDRKFLSDVLEKYKDAVAVGVDLKDGMVAIHGWEEKTAVDGMTFLEELAEKKVATVIVTDISKDGAMQGTNVSLYQSLAHLEMQVIASGGVSSYNDVEALNQCGIYGAIIGKAIYTGDIHLPEAISLANGRKL